MKRILDTGGSGFIGSLFGQNLKDCEEKGFKYMNRYLIVYGTRPEAIKLKPLIKEMSKEGLDYEVVFTGQQIDLAGGLKNDHDFSIFSHIEECNGARDRLNELLERLLKNFRYLLKSKFTHVIVQGDTASAYAGALAAFHRKIPIIHIEAGLRTYERDPFPEEFYRRSISLMADYHFCPTSQNESNIIEEFVRGERHVVGNTGLDGLDNSNVTCNNEILVTFHRRENEKGAVWWGDELHRIVIDNPDYDFVIVGHPNETHTDFRVGMNYCLMSDDYKQPSNMKFIPPLNYKEMTERLKTCRLVITDSGGISEEMAFFGKRALICRSSTERSEGLENHHLLCMRYEDLGRKWLDIIKLDPIVTSPCPFGDGKASEKIVKILKDI